VKQLLTILCFSISLNTVSAQLEVDQKKYFNAQLEWSGHNMREGHDGPTYPVGIWEYWYISGQRRLVTDRSEDGTKYIDMWLPDSTQVLKNGNGYYFEVENSSLFIDSTFFEIKDSLKHGAMKKYRKMMSDGTYGPYVLIQEGHFYRNKKNGRYWSHDLFRHRSNIYYYRNGQLFGQCFTLDENGNILVIKRFFNDKNRSEWTYFNKNGYLQKKENYLDGVLHGDYTEYYLDGKVRVTGKYLKWTEIQELKSRDPKTYKEVTERIERPVGVKNGMWTTYDQRGRTIQKEEYLYGKKIG